MGSEGTRPALLPAGPVPERWNVKSVFIETPHGPAISWTSSLDISYVPSNPGRVSPTVNHSSNQDGFRVVCVVNGKRKAVRKCPVEAAICLWMNSTKYFQGLNVRVKTGKEVISQSRFLLLVKMKSLNQVVTRRVKDSQSHRIA